MLAVPGALVALGLAYLAALGTVDRDRRDLALLRARGATRRWLLAVAVAESGADRAGRRRARRRRRARGGFTDHPRRRRPDGRTRPRSPPRHASRSPIGGRARRADRRRPRRCGARASPTAAAATQRERKPLWQRLYLDLVALALSGLIYWLTASTGFSAVVNPDSNPTLSLSVYMFFAPALLWIGATLLLVRLRGRALAWVAAARGRRPRQQHARVPARQRRPAQARDQPRPDRRRRCCSRSGSTSGSSPPPTTSRRTSTPSSRSAPTSPPPRHPA